MQSLYPCVANSVRNIHSGMQGNNYGFPCLVCMLTLMLWYEPKDLISAMHIHDLHHFEKERH